MGEFDQFEKSDFFIFLYLIIEKRKKNPEN